MTESYYPSEDIKTYEDLPSRYKQQFSPFGKGFVRREAYENYMEAKSSPIVFWWILCLRGRASSIIDGVRRLHYPENPETLPTTADC